MAWSRQRSSRLQNDMAVPVAPARPRKLTWKETRELEGMEARILAVEAEIARLESAQERMEFMADLGLAESGLEQLVRAGYRMLNLITFYTTVGTELRAWTVMRGTRAPQAAGKIHTDMEHGFIKAEVVSYDDFVKAGSLSAAREEGHWRLEGKEYTVRDGDILHFKFSQ